MAGRKPVVQCTQAEWRSLTRGLRACCPAPEGYDWRFIWCVSVDTEQSTGDSTRTVRTGGKLGTLRIRVLKGLSEMETLDTLIHEMAHAYDTTWGPHHGWAGHHSDTFWIWVGRIYRRWHGE